MEGPYDRPCPGCEGTGRVMARAWADWLRVYRRIEFGIADPVTRLAALVDHMNARPAHVEITLLPCPHCDGVGYLLTCRGRQLVGLLRRLLPELVDRQLRRAKPGAAPPSTAGSSPPAHLRPL